MKLFPTLIAAGGLLPCLFQCADAGLVRRPIYYNPSYNGGSYYGNHYPIQYSRQTSIFGSRRFGREYYPSYYRSDCVPSYYRSDRVQSDYGSHRVPRYHRYGPFGHSFGIRIGSGYGCGYWGY